MNIQRFFILLCCLAGLAAVVLVVLIEQSFRLSSSSTSHMAFPSSEEKKPLRTAVQGIAHVESEPQVSRMQVVQTNNSTVEPQQASAPEEMVKPFFYMVRPEDLGKLSEDQQKIFASTQDEYVSYYNQWMNTWPHDSEAWNRKMVVLQQDLTDRIGPDGMDNLLR